MKCSVWSICSLMMSKIFKRLFTMSRSATVAIRLSGTFQKKRCQEVTPLMIHDIQYNETQRYILEEMLSRSYTLNDTCIQHNRTQRYILEEMLSRRNTLNDIQYNETQWYILEEMLSRSYTLNATCIQHNGTQRYILEEMLPRSNTLNDIQNNQGWRNLTNVYLSTDKWF